jgi:hypothetical protein
VNHNPNGSGDVGTIHGRPCYFGQQDHLLRRRV